MNGSIMLHCCVLHMVIYIYCTTAVHFTHFSPVSDTLAVWFPTYSVWARTQAHLLYSDTQSTPVTFMFPLTHDAWWKKKKKTTTLSIPFITAVWATGCTTAPENVVKMMIQIHILQLTLLLPIFSTWFAVFRKRERRRVCQGACRNKDLQFGNCQCCLLTVNVPPFVYGMDMADVHSASWLYKVVLSSEFMREHYAFSSVLGLTLLLLPVLLCFPRCQGANTLTPRSSSCT